MDRVLIPKEEKEAFRLALEALKGADIRFVIGGAFAMYHYTGIWRYTKDIDIFLVPQDVQRALNVLQDIGYYTRIEADYWLAKAFRREYMIDLIFGEGNWLHKVDEEWIKRSRPGRVLGVAVRIAPIEEIIWSKAYVAERTRYDGADICHLIKVSQGKIDWQHLIDRFGEHWELLFSYINLFRFVYPSHSDFIPKWVMEELIGRLKKDLERPPLAQKICRGTLLNRISYIHDIEEEGYHDPREELAVALGHDVKDVIIERRWAAKKAHRVELHVA